MVLEVDEFVILTLQEFFDLSLRIADDSESDDGGDEEDGEDWEDEYEGEGEDEEEDEEEFYDVEEDEKFGYGVIERP